MLKNRTVCKFLSMTQFLDQCKTAFFGSFKFDDRKFRGATNPHLDGKEVLVIAVSSNGKTEKKKKKCTYAFIDVCEVIEGDPARSISEEIAESNQS